MAIKIKLTYDVNRIKDTLDAIGWALANYKFPSYEDLGPDIQYQTKKMTVSIDATITDC